MNLIFDLDGTLLDSRERLYRLFQALVPQSELTHSAYWDLKRSKVSNETILANKFGLNQSSIRKFLREWMALIESPEYLAMDQAFPGVHEALRRLTASARIYVCTARQHRELAIAQLDRLELLPYFEMVLVTGQSQSKQKLLLSVPALSSKDWIICDTGKDIMAGKEVGIKTCAVLNGFLSENSLRAYSPDRIIPRAIDFVVD